MKNLLNFITELRNRNSIDRGDQYHKYWKYCTLKIASLRRAINSQKSPNPLNKNKENQNQNIKEKKSNSNNRINEKEKGKGKGKGKQSKKIKKNPLNQSREILIFQAERNWTAGMELRKDSMTEPRKMYHSRKKFKRAIHFIEELDNFPLSNPITDSTLNPNSPSIITSPSPSPSSIPISDINDQQQKIYLAYMKAYLNLEYGNWELTMKFLSISLQSGFMIKESETIFRYCKYQMERDQRYNNSSISNFNNLSLKEIDEITNSIKNDLKIVNGNGENDNQNGLDKEEISMLSSPSHHLKKNQLKKLRIKYKNNQESMKTIVHYQKLCLYHNLNSRLKKINLDRVSFNKDLDQGNKFHKMYRLYTQAQKLHLTDSNDLVMIRATCGYYESLIKCQQGKWKSAHDLLVKVFEMLPCKTFNHHNNLIDRDLSGKIHDLRLIIESNGENCHFQLQEQQKPKIIPFKPIFYDLAIEYLSDPRNKHGMENEEMEKRIDDLNEKEEKSLFGSFLSNIWSR